MRGFVRRAAREVRGAGLSGIKGSSGVVKDSRCMQGQPPGVVKTCSGGKGQLRGVKGRGVSLPAVTTKAPGSKDRGARVCVSSCYAIHRRQHGLTMKML